MRVPRDLAGDKLALLLRNYGFVASRQTGSHLRLTSTVTGIEHHITVPRHRELRLGTLLGILNDVAAYLKIDRDELAAELFGR